MGLHYFFPFQRKPDHFSHLFRTCRSHIQLWRICLSKISCFCFILQILYYLLTGLLLLIRCFQSPVPLLSNVTLPIFSRHGILILSCFLVFIIFGFRLIIHIRQDLFIEKPKELTVLVHFKQSIDAMCIIM